MLELNARWALEVAHAIVEAECGNTDTASPEGHAAREALRWLESILDQKGCEHFDPAVTDGKLTTLIEIIVWG